MQVLSTNSSIFLVSVNNFRPRKNKWLRIEETNSHWSTGRIPVAGLRIEASFLLSLEVHFPIRSSNSMLRLFLRFFVMSLYGEKWKKGRSQNLAMQFRKVPWAFSKVWRIMVWICESRVWRTDGQTDRGTDGRKTERYEMGCAVLLKDKIIIHNVFGSY